MANYEQKIEPVAPLPPAVQSLVETIQQRLVEQLAEIRHIDPREVDITRTFNSYGLNSLDILRLAWDLEEGLSRPMDVNLLWDYPTIESLIRFLTKEGLI